MCPSFTRFLLFGLALAGISASSTLQASATEVSYPGNSELRPGRTQHLMYIPPAELGLFEPIMLSVEGDMPAIENVIFDPNAVTDVSLQPMQPISVFPVDNGVVDTNSGSRSTREEGLRLPFDTREFPWRTMVKLYMVFPNGQRSMCSGTYMLGNSLVLTAAHCLYSHENGFASQVIIAPGKNTRVEPFGQYLVTNMSVPDLWVSGGGPPFDIAVMRVEDGSGVGWMGTKFYTRESDWSRKDIIVGGYPGENYSGDTLFWFPSKISSATALGRMVVFTGYAEGGFSGGPSLLGNPTDPMSWELCGALTYGQVDAWGRPQKPGTNWSNVITSDVWSWILDKHQEWNALIPIEIYSNGERFWNDSTLDVKFVNKVPAVRNGYSLWAVVEVGGAFFYLPSFSSWPSPYSSGYVDGEVKLIDNLYLSGLKQFLDLTFHTAIINDRTGAVVSEPLVASKSVRLEP